MKRYRFNIYIFFPLLYQIMEKNKSLLNKVDNLNITEIKTIIKGLKKKNYEQLNQIEKQLIIIFYAYQIQFIQIIYIMTFYYKFLPIVKTYIWFENKYINIKNYLFSFFVI